MTTSPVADDASAEIPAFPQPCAAVCPFDPSPELRGLAGRGPLTRVRSWNDSTPWVVTGHAEQKTLLSDPGSAPTSPTPASRAPFPTRAANGSPPT
ncbi:hypothetical protein [Streptomyces asiaticus]|uniref:hypothetical protein n=1 Tax=Streptomyces asiaticus TaxID=114695 RepID=UPI003F4CAF52